MTRVLVVDDSSLLCDLLSELLTDSGHDVVKVDSDFQRLLLPGWAGWADVATIVCDLNLADELTGVDILTACAAHHPNVQRIAWTGSGHALIDQAREVATVIQKPGIDEVLAATR